MKKLRIAIASGGRFHVLDLARELHRRGHEVRFYSFVPRYRAAKFGLAEECHVGLLRMAAPLLAWERVASSLAPHVREKLLYLTLNWGAAAHLQACDVFICMSGVYLEAAYFAKERFGARIWLERGSRHILSQDQILAGISGARRPTALTIRRELEGYAIADRIVVPSAHVAQSFHNDQAAHSKLFVNPYGVDITMFPQRNSTPANEPYTFLFVGEWSLQKGCDLLVGAVMGTPGTRLVHIGRIGDIAFPRNEPQFTHLAAVQQWQLAQVYKAADALVHASRQDGLSLVLAQALAVGLPVICTDRTGGIDLAHTPALAERITVVPHDDPAALSEALARHRDRISNPSRLSESDRGALSWAAYGKRYDDELQRAFA